MANTHTDAVFHGWFIDSSATRHMCSDKNNFTNMRESTVTHATVADQVSMVVWGQSEVNSKTSSGEFILLSNVLYVPDLAANLISVSYIDKKGGCVVFKNSKCDIYNK